MYIFNDNIKLNNKKDKKNDKIWSSDFIKQSEKEPTKVMEGLIRKLKEEPKEIKDTNQVSLEEKREDNKNTKDHKILEVILNKDNKEEVKLTIEDGLNKADTRNNEYYKEETLPLYTKYVFPKNKQDSKKNREYYKKYKELMQDGDVVTSGKKSKINKKSNIVEDIYIKKVDPKDQSENSEAFDDTKLKEINEKCKKNG